MDDSPFEEMAERVPWLRPIDYDILDWFSRHDEVEDGFKTNPSTVFEHIDYEDQGYVADRCIVLSKAGFLEQHHGPKYTLTDLGWKLLNSDLEEDEVPNDPTDD